MVTGTLEGMTREEAKRAVAAAGGAATESVSKKTDFVVAGPGAGAKLATATRLGVPVIDQDAFAQVLAGERPVPSRDAGADGA